MATRDNEEKSGSGSSWWDEMFVSEEEAARRQVEIERLKGITPEMKRRREIKAGVITASVGIALVIFLFILMGGIIASGRVSDAAAAVLSRLWVVGVIPLFVGAALIFNGIFVSKHGREKTPGVADLDTKELEMSAASNCLSAADTSDLASGVPFSVTDETTRHLHQKIPTREK